MRVSLGAIAYAITAGLLFAGSPLVQAGIISAQSQGDGGRFRLDDLHGFGTANPFPAGFGSAPAPYNVAIHFPNPAGTGSGGGTGVPSFSYSVSGSSSDGAAFSDVDGLPGLRTTSASGGVTNVVFSLTLGSTPWLSITGTVSSSAQISGDYGSLVATGASTIQSLGLSINGTPIDLSAYVGTSVAPNTNVALGITGSMLILNEQTISPDNSSINVNAFHLTSTKSGDQATVILGHSQAMVVATPEPSSIALAAFGFVGLMVWCWRRNR